MSRILILSFALLLTQCKTLKHTTKIESIDIQGHRGCRGLLPENTVPAFLHALDLGVNTLELDVVVTKDKVVVVSHEPFLNHEICRDLDGNPISKKEEKSFNIYQLTFEELTKYDCGLSAHPKYPEQKNIAVSKPSLEEMILAAERHANLNNREAPLYNIEIKRTKEGDLSYHPDYKEFTELTMEVILKNKIEDRTTVQCFDLEVLQYLKEAYPNQDQVLLIANNNDPLKNIRDLGHTPEVYSPYFKLVDANLVAFCKEQEMKLIPWTVNEVVDMKKMIALGVDGIITDYPNRLINLNFDQ